MLKTSFQTQAVPPCAAYPLLHAAPAAQAYAQFGRQSARHPGRNCRVLPCESHPPDRVPVRNETNPDTRLVETHYRRPKPIHSMLLQQTVNFALRICPIARPPILRWMRHHLGTHRVQFDERMQASKYISSWVRQERKRPSQSVPLLRYVRLTYCT